MRSGDLGTLHGIARMSHPGGPYSLAAPAAGSTGRAASQHAMPKQKLTDASRRVPARSASRPAPDRLLVHLVRGLRRPRLARRSQDVHGALPPRGTLRARESWACTRSSSLADARPRARQVVGEVADDRDPTQARRDARLAPTFEHLANLYMEKHAPVKKRSWKEDRRVMNNELFPTWHTIAGDRHSPPEHPHAHREDRRTAGAEHGEPHPGAHPHDVQFRHRSRGRRVQPVRATRASGQGARPRSHPDRRGDPPVLVGAGWRAAHLAATFRLRPITA